MEQFYRIGDVSDRLGISRDTLRFYEKKGMIKPQKQQNGYRCYTYHDLRVLLDIMFYRKFNFTIEEINGIMLHSTYDSIQDMLQKKIEEEIGQLNRHKQSLKSLRITKGIMSRVEHHLKDYSIMALPEFYVLEDQMVWGRQQLFELCYIYEEFALGMHGCGIESVSQHLVVPVEAVIKLGMENALNGELWISRSRCVYTIVEADHYSPSHSHILDAVTWAQDQGYVLEGKVLAGYLLNCVKDGEPVYYIELYLPIIDG